MNGKEIVCEHCGGTIIGMIYRVTSEEDGVVMLDMTVCKGCSIEGRNLGLMVQELNPIEQERLRHS